MAPPTPTPNPNEVNHALNGTATADSQWNDHAPSRAIDNNWVDDNYKWSSESSEPHWLKIDLGSSKSLSRFVIKHQGVINDSWRNLSNFKIQGSNNDSSYNDLMTVTGNTGNETTHTITAASYRYIKLYITDSGGDSYARVPEFQIWGVSGSATPTPTPTPAVTATPTPVVTATPTPIPPSSKASWGFNSNGNDSSGNGYNATLYGNPSYNTSDKKEGTASLFITGNSQYAQANLVSTLTNNVTITGWVKCSGVTSGYQLIAYNGDPGFSGYGIYVNHGNGDKLCILLGGKAFLDTANTLTANQWTHLTAVRRNGTWEFYINGSNVSITGNTTTPNTPAGNTVIGGKSGGGDYFNGLLDNVSIYESALTASQISALAAQ